MGHTFPPSPLLSPSATTVKWVGGLATTQHLDSQSFQICQNHGTSCSRTCRRRSLAWILPG